MGFLDKLKALGQQAIDEVENLGSEAKNALEDYYKSGASINPLLGLYNEATKHFLFGNQPTHTQPSTTPRQPPPTHVKPFKPAPPGEDPAIVRTLQKSKAAKIMMGFLSQNSVLFKKANPTQRYTMTYYALTNPDYLFSLAQKDPGLKWILKQPPKVQQELRDVIKQKQKVWQTLPYEGDAVHHDSAFWDILGGGTESLVTKLPFIKSLINWGAQDIGSRIASELYQQHTGHQAPWWIPFAGGFLGGAGAGALTGRFGKALEDIHPEPEPDHPQVSFSMPTVVEEGSPKPTPATEPPSFQELIQQLKPKDEEDASPSYVHSYKQSGIPTATKVLEPEDYNTSPSYNVVAKQTNEPPTEVPSFEDLLKAIKPQATEEPPKFEEIIQQLKDNEPKTTEDLKWQKFKQVVDSQKDNPTNPTDTDFKLYGFSDPASTVVYSIFNTLKKLKGAIKDEKEAQEALKEYPELQEYLEQKQGGSAIKNLFYKLVPRYDQLAKTPYGLDVYRSAEKYTKNLERDIHQFFKVKGKKLFDALGNLTPPEKELVRSALEGERPVEGLPNKLQPVVNATRKMLDSVFQYARDNGLLKDEQYRQNYFPHVFDGSISITTPKGTRVVSDWDEAFHVLKQLDEEGITPKIKILTHTHTPETAELLGDTTHKVELSPEDIQKIMQAIKSDDDRIGKKFVGNLLERKYGVQGYITDPTKALERYIYGIAKKVHQDQLMKDIKPVLDKIKDPALKEGIKDYIRQVLGYPSKTEEAIAHTLSHILNTKIGRIITRTIMDKPVGEISPQTIKNAFGRTSLWLNHVGMLGFAVSTALINVIQALHVLPGLGIKANAEMLREIAKYLTRDPEKIAELVENNIVSHPEAVDGAMDKLSQFALAPMSKSDELARVSTYEGVKAWAKNLVKSVGDFKARQQMVKKLLAMGFSNKDPVIRDISTGDLEKAIKDFATSFSDRAVFRYERYASPEFLSSSFTRMLFPFKIFLSNYLTLSANYLTNGLIKRNDVVGALLFHAVPLLLGGVYIHPLFAVPFAILNKVAEAMGYNLPELIKKHLGKTGEVLLHGLPALGGVSLKYSLEADIPTKPEDIFGPIPQTAWKTFDTLVNKHDLKDAIKEGLEPLEPRMIKAIKDIKDMLDTGQMMDSKGHVIAPATTKDMILRALGFQPEKKVAYYEAKEQMAEIGDEYKREYHPMFDALVNAIIKHDKDGERKAVAHIRQAIKKWEHKYKHSHGLEKDKARYMLIRLYSDYRDIPREVRSRLVQYYSNPAKRKLYEDALDNNQ